MEKDSSSPQLEAGGGGPQSVSHWRLVRDQALVTPEVENWKYQGAGTDDDPYVVQWIDNDPRNPMLFSEWKKWSLTAVVAIATLAVAFCSSAYSGGVDEIIEELGCSTEVSILGLSLFVLGFAIGPLIWAPMSELFGRQILFISTYALLTAFNAGAAGSQNIWTLIILRFFAGAFGSSPLTNAGGVIADMFAAEERGLAMSLFAAAPFLGPVLGPIVGGFVGQTIGWRWIEGLMAIFTGVLWIIGSLTLPETYPPVILRQRATKLSQMTGKVYRSKGEIDQGKIEFSKVFKTALLRPWLLLFREPIVFLLSIYMAIIYGTLYMLFSAFPIVYEEKRGWSQGIGGLAFLGVGVGMLLSIAYSIYDNKRYVRISRAHNGFAPPEARLPTCMIGGISLTIGLFWFAWTNSPDIQYMVSIAAGVPFGFGMVLVFLSIMNYLIDAYVIFAASVLAANSVLRSLMGFAFPLFTTQMYDNLGIHWASSIPGFLALACVPFPFLFYKYGPAIRERCKFAAQAAAFMRNLQERKDTGAETSQEALDDEQEAADYSWEEEKPQFEGIKTGNNNDQRADQQSLRSTRSRAQSTNSLKHTKSYQGNPYDIDRVATKESFPNPRSRASSSARK